MLVLMYRVLRLSGSGYLGLNKKATQSQKEIFDRLSGLGFGISNLQIQSADNVYRHGLTKIIRRFPQLLWFTTLWWICNWHPVGGDSPSTISTELDGSRGTSNSPTSLAILKSIPGIKPIVQLPGIPRVIEKYTRDQANPAITLQAFKKRIGLQRSIF